MKILKRLLGRFSERLYRWCHADRIDKSPAELVDLLITTDIKCFMAQDNLMKCVGSANITKFAVDAQELNAKRNKLMRSLDDMLGFPNFLTKKTYE